MSMCSFVLLAYDGIWMGQAFGHRVSPPRACEKVTICDNRIPCCLQLAVASTSPGICSQAKVPYHALVEGATATVAYMNLPPRDGLRGYSTMCYSRTRGLEWRRPECASLYHTQLRWHLSPDRLQRTLEMLKYQQPRGMNANLVSWHVKSTCVEMRHA